MSDPVGCVYRTLETARGYSPIRRATPGFQPIVADLLARLENDSFARDRAEQYHLDIRRSFCGDGL